MYGFYSGFSGVSLFGSFALMTYNTFYTSFQPVCYIFDKDVSPATLLRQPKLYQSRHACSNKKSLDGEQYLFAFLFNPHATFLTKTFLAPHCSGRNFQINLISHFLFVFTRYSFFCSCGFADLLVARCQFSRFVLRFIGFLVLLSFLIMLTF